MSALAYTIGVVLFALGLLVSIVLHEVGHMVSAKLFGVKVTQFFVGFGKTLWSTRKGETEYGVKAFPVGGFVKIIGMLPPERRREGPDRKRGYWGKVIAEARAADHQEVSLEDQHRVFYALPSWKKLIVMLCGPATNMALAVVILGIVFVAIGVVQPTLTINRVSDCVIPASQQGRPCQPADPVSPARQAGIHVGDRIVSVNGTPMKSWDQLASAIENHAHQTMTLVVERDGQQVRLTATPTVNQIVTTGTSGESFSRSGFLGVSPTQVRQRQGVGYVFSTIGDYTVRTGQALAHLPSKMVGVAKAAAGLKPRSQESPMSVVGATRLAGDVAAQQQVSVVDKVAFALSLLGLVNLFVALFNFIPLLPLDGGHMAGGVYEAVRRAWARVRRRPDPGYADVAKMLPVAYTVAAVLIVMGVILVWADIVNPIKLTG